MPKFRMTLDNGAGVLDQRTFDGDEAELAQAIADFVIDIGSFRDGDSIVIKEIED